MVATTPAALAEDPDFRGPVVFEFNERISERTSGGPLNDAVEVSPVTGEVRVRHRRQSLEVTLQGGFRPGLVYRVRVKPVVEDLFSNTMRNPFELVFSTGGEVQPSVVAGEVVDRLQLLPAEGVTVIAEPVRSEEPLMYLARTDSAGIFAIRYLPGGFYRITAVQDVNRDLVVDPFEAQASAQVNLPASDTVILSFRTLVPDTTPARLVDVEPEDSIGLRLSFDDFLDPFWSTDSVRILLADSAGSLADSLPTVTAILHEHELPEFRQAWQDSVAAVQAARADSIAAAERAAADSAAAGDSLAVGGAPPEERAVRPPAQAPGAAGRPGEEEEPSEPLPSQDLIAILSSPLPPGTVLQVSVVAVENIARVRDGGGTQSVTIPIPEVPVDSLAADSLAADSTGVPPDTTGAVPDTTGVPPDTTGLPPDTTGVPPDTTAVPADTTTVPPDTTGVPPDTTTVPPDTTGVPPDTTGVPPDTTGVPPDTTGPPPGTTGPPPGTTGSRPAAPRRTPDTRPLP